LFTVAPTWTSPPVTTLFSIRKPASSQVGGAACRAEVSNVILGRVYGVVRLIRNVGNEYFKGRFALPVANTVSAVEEFICIFLKPAIDKKLVVRNGYYHITALAKECYHLPHRH
jgi:hypothetical protein